MYAGKSSWDWEYSGGGGGGGISEFMTKANKDKLVSYKHKNQ